MFLNGHRVFERRTEGPVSLCLWRTNFHCDKTKSIINIGTKNIINVRTKRNMYVYVQIR